jgi:NADH-quinone oxidoreductase subunit N
LFSFAEFFGGWFSFRFAFDLKSVLAALVPPSSVLPDTARLVWVLVPVLPLVTALASLIVVRWVAGGRPLAHRLYGAVGVVALVLGIVLTLGTARPAGLTAFGGVLTLDVLAQGSGLLLLALAALAWLTVALPTPPDTRPGLEFPFLVLALVAGAWLAVHSLHGLAIWMSIELMSVAGYGLTLYHRQDARAAEAGLKYLLYGAVTSAVMLYGLSLLYGLSGSLYWNAQQALGTQPTEAVVLAYMLIALGLWFKAGVFPMHFWVPEVYQTAPLRAVALFATLPKLAAVAVLYRLTEALTVAAPDTAPALRLILGAVVFLTLAWGNLLAFFQTDARRLLAFSGIAHSGLLLIPVFALDAARLETLLVWSLAYGLMTIAAFALTQHAEHLTGTAQFHRWGGYTPAAFVGWAVVALALAGLPPTFGFTAKLNLYFTLWASYTQAHESLFLVLIITLLVQTVIGVFYYLKLPTATLTRNSQHPAAPVLPWPTITVLAVLVILGVVGFDRLGYLLTHL